MSAKTKVIAIDGPSGSGKSTIAKIIAKELGLTYLDTGALYRAIAYTLDSKKILETELDKIQSTLSNLKFEYGKSENELIIINGENLTSTIREHKVSELASKYSKLPVVRNFLQSFQREFAQTHPSVLEGRDIGTVIFPNAALKIFLTADSGIRAKRRLDQLRDQGESDITLEAILSDIKKRDQADITRSIAPLKRADDAVEIDTSSKDITKITAQIKDLYSKNSFFFPS